MKKEINKEIIHSLKSVYLSVFEIKLNTINNENENYRKRINEILNINYKKK